MPLPTYDESVDRLRLCCAMSCGRPAEFEILTLRRQGIAGPDPYGDSTDACQAHVGVLLGYQPKAVRPEEIFWEVHNITQGA